MHAPTPGVARGFVAPVTGDLSQLNRRKRTAESEIPIFCNNRHLVDLLLERM